MNLDNTIKDIFDQGAIALTIGRNPEVEGVFFGQVQIPIRTGPGNDRLNGVFQSEGRDIAVILQGIRSQIGHCKELEPVEGKR